MSRGDSLRSWVRTGRAMGRDSICENLTAPGMQMWGQMVMHVPPTEHPRFPGEMSQAHDTRESTKAQTVH